MSMKAWLKRKLCPHCVTDEEIARKPVIGILERSADALDRIAADLRRTERHARTTARDGANPFLGQRSIHVQRKERPR